MLRRFHGFTVLEIVIAAGLLSGLFLGVFQIFRSGSDSFKVGSWRIQTQKQAQTFLTRLRELLERANPPMILESGSLPVPVTSQPITLHTGFNSGPVTLAGTGGILYFSVSKAAQRPGVDGGLIGVSSEDGVWTGVSLAYGPLPDGQHQLILVQSGQTNDLDDWFGLPYDMPGSDFQRAPTAQRNRVTLNDVRSIHVTTASHTIDITVTMAKLTGGLETVITEKMHAKLIHPEPVEVSSY